MPPLWGYCFCRLRDLSEVRMESSELLYLLWSTHES